MNEFCFSAPLNSSARKENNRAVPVSWAGKADRGKDGDWWKSVSRVIQSDCQTLQQAARPSSHELTRAICLPLMLRAYRAPPPPPPPKWSTARCSTSAGGRAQRRSLQIAGGGSETQRRAHRRARAQRAGAGGSQRRARWRPQRAQRACAAGQRAPRCAAAAALWCRK